MTELRFEEKLIPSAELTGESQLPAMFNNLKFNLKYDTGDDSGLFIGYGLRTNPLPHKMQDRYDSELKEIPWKTAVLENQYLKATFIPDLGGRLWSLYDKEKKRNLITENPVIKPGNLAICNAWCSGGVEWNIGTRGHHARTCRSMFTAVAPSYKGSPVLRMYEFSRENGVAYQMDFFLPEDSKFLFMRARIHNHHSKVIPMYWWSNIAVDDWDDMRIVTPAKRTFSNTYVSNFEHALKLLDMPSPDGFDCTYPVNYSTSKDHFFKIDDRDRKFEAALFGDGWGLCQCSTDRLKGRKLFVWGRSTGGQSWQRALTAQGGLPYIEIQAGLANTQLECLPMPPRTAWEWLEAYGPLQTDPAKTHGPWSDAQAESEAQLEAALPRQLMDDMLAETKELVALKPAEKIICRGSGWGALEKARCGKRSNFAPHLDFDSDDTEPAIWYELLEKGTMPEWDMNTPPPSYMVQDEFFELLSQAPANPLRDFQMGLNFYLRNDYAKAEEYFKASRNGDKCFVVDYALANTRRCMGDVDGTKDFFCAGIYCHDQTYLKEAMQTICDSNYYDLVISIYENLPEDLQQLAFNKICYIAALLNTGRLEEAEDLLMENGGIDVPQLREGERSLSELYIKLQTLKAEREGKTIDPSKLVLPHKLDFRMNTVTGKTLYGALPLK